MNAFIAELTLVPQPTRAAKLVEIATHDCLGTKPIVAIRDSRGIAFPALKAVGIEIEGGLTIAIFTGIEFFARCLFFFIPDTVFTLVAFVALIAPVIAGPNSEVIRRLADR